MTELERFEIRAHTFKAMTGYMAPGKDVSVMVNMTEEQDGQRRGAWEVWNKAYGLCLSATLDAVDAIGVTPADPDAF